MKKFFIYFVFICSVVVVQTSVMPQLFSYGFPVSVLLPLVIAWTIVDGFLVFLPWLILLGLVVDLATYQPAGMSVILFLLVSYFVSFFSKRFSIDAQGGGFFLTSFFLFSGYVAEKLYTGAWVGFLYGKQQASEVLLNFDFSALLVLMVVEMLMVFLFQKIIRKTKLFFELK